jgi:DNA-binding SARP family transcriptional activator
MDTGEGQAASRAQAELTSAGASTSLPAIRVLGPLEIGPPDRPARIEGKLVRLLAVLIANINEPVTVDRLCDAVWGDERPATYESGLRGHLTRARAALADAGCAFSIDARSWGDEPGYCLTVDPDEVDHARFSQLAERSRIRPTTTTELQAALKLWRGTPFAGIDLQGLQPTVFRLEERCLALTERLALLHLGEGRPDDAVTLLQDQHAAHLDRETTCAVLARALLAAGRQPEALEACQQTMRYLREEFGLEPTSTVADVELLILTQHEDREPSRDALWERPPDALLQRCTGPFVGREDLLGRLRQLLDGVDVHGGSVLMVGEAGMGKTRLLAEVARDVTRDGARCVHVAVDPISPGPFHVGSSLLSTLLIDQPGPVAAAAQAGLDAIAAHRAATEPAAAQRTLERCLDALVRAIGARPAPLFLLLDDLQWVDSASLSIIRHLIRSGGPNLGVVMAARRGDHGPSWDEFVAQVPSSPIETIAVGPLTVDAITRWMADLGLDVGLSTTTIAATVHRESAGVAFVVDGVLHELASANDPIGALERLRDGLVPEDLYDPVRARISRLEPHDARLLAVAAVMSTHPAPEEVAAVCRSLFGPGDWLIDERRCLGLVRADSTRPGDFVFEHSITRAVLQDTLSRSERQFVHRATARGGLDGSTSAAAAFHLVEAIPLVDAAEALAAVEAAASEATTLFAFEEAAVLYRKALAIHGRYPQPDGEAAQLDLRTELGRAMQYLGAREAALDTFADTMHRAAELGCWDALVRCALAAADFGEVLDPDDPVRRLLLAGLDLLPDGHPGRRLLAVEAIIKTTIVEGATEEVCALFDDELGAIGDSDPAVLQRRRAWLHMSAGSPNATERRHEAEVLQRAASGRTGRDWLDATLFLLSAELELGRTSRADRLHSAYDVAAVRSGRPGVRWLSTVAAADLAQLRGRLGEGSAHASRALAFGLDHAIPDARRSHAGHHLVTALLVGQDRGPFGSPPPDALTRSEDPVLLGAAALLGALGGHAEEATSALMSAAWLLDRMPVSTLRPFAIGLCAEAWLHLGRPDDPVEILLRLVRPYHDTMWRMALVGASLGPVDRHLGALLAAHGEPQEGGVALERAGRLAFGAQAPVWELASAVELARIRRGSADQATVRRLAARPAVQEAIAVVRSAEALFPGA